MTKWWKRQHNACKEACVLTGIACIALFSLMFSGETEVNNSIEDALLKDSTSYRIAGPTGEFSLIFKDQNAYIGGKQFNIYGRVKPAEAKDIKRSLLSCQMIRDLGKRQLDMEQQRAYGFENAITLSAPGQESWTVSTGVDKKGYALSQSGRLFALDRDLAAQLRRSPEALRDNTLGLPIQCQRITAQHPKGSWSVNTLHGHWWLETGNNAQLIDQSVISDLLTVLSTTQAVSFGSKAHNKTSGSLNITGVTDNREQNITLIDHGAAPISASFRMVERQELLNNKVLHEFFIIDVDKSLFQFPAQGLLSKRLIPFDTAQANEIKINDLHTRKIDGIWYLANDLPADQLACQKLIKQLGELPNAITTETKKIGSIRHGSLQFQIPATDGAMDVAKACRHHLIVDQRLFPNVATKDINGLVIQSPDSAPQLYQKDEHGEWDIDPAIHTEISDFIEALSAARVRSWNGPFNEKLAWSSTLTIAYKDKRIVIKKTDQHFIGIEDYNVQGYLDKDSIADLFGE